MGSGGRSKFRTDSEAVSGPGSLEKIVALPYVMGGVRHCKSAFTPSFASGVLGLPVA